MGNICSAPPPEAPGDPFGVLPKSLSKSFTITGHFDPDYYGCQMKGAWNGFAHDKNETKVLYGPARGSIASTASGATVDAGLPFVTNASLQVFIKEFTDDCNTQAEREARRHPPVPLRRSQSRLSRLGAMREHCVPRNGLTTFPPQAMVFKSLPQHQVRHPP